MKKRNITTAVLAMALAVAMTVPAWAASVTEIEVLQIDEPPSTDAPERTQTNDTAPRAEAAAPGTQSSGTQAPGEGTSGIPARDSGTAAPSARGSGEAGTPSRETVQLTSQQRSVILELIPDDLYRFYTSGLWDAVPETSVNISALSSQDLVNELYGVLRNAGRTSAIFTPVEHAAVEGYSVWFDKDDALEKMQGLYGRAVTESAIAAYNNEWGGDMPDMVAIDGNAIASLNPEGEGKVRPSIASCVTDGEDLIVSLTFTATFDDTKNNGSGRATAVFASDAASIAGYRLKSITLD